MRTTKEELERLSEKLLPIAKEVSLKAYAPFSHFRVGAALLCEGGEIFSGCNVENRSFGLTNCAERSALFKAISEGKRDFKAIAIYSPDSAEVLTPCGACRQVLSEFSSTLLFFCFASNEKYQIFQMEELYPADTLQGLKKQF